MPAALRRTRKGPDAECGTPENRGLQVADCGFSMSGETVAAIGSIVKAADNAFKKLESAHRIEPDPGARIILQ
jgi:hypothetical protein